MRAPNTKFLGTLLVLVTLAGSPAPAAEFFLTGLVKAGKFERVMLVEQPEGILHTLEPGRASPDLEVLRVDYAHGAVRLRRGTNLFTAAFPGHGASGTYAEFARTGELPPDFEGKWPAGYEPKLIRDHRAGRLGTNAPSLLEGVTTSVQFIDALDTYARSLPPRERAAFAQQAESFNGVSSDNGHRPEDPTAKPPASPAALLAAADFQNLKDDEAALLRKILSGPPPAPGALSQSGDDPSRLDALGWKQKSPKIRHRIELELLGYEDQSSLPAGWIR